MRTSVPGPAYALATLEATDALTHRDNITHCLVAWDAVRDGTEIAAGYAVVGVTDAAGQHFNEHLAWSGLAEWQFF